MLGQVMPQRLGGSQRPAMGFTLVELMVTLVIAGTLLAFAVPSMREFIARKRVEGVANELATDLRYLRSLQIERNRIEGMRIRFGSNGTSTCYVIIATSPARGADCDCGNTPVCNAAAGAEAEIKTVRIERSTGVLLEATPESLEVRGANGMPSGGATLQVAVRSSLGGELQVNTNQAGRPALCSLSGPAGALKVCTP